MTIKELIKDEFLYKKGDSSKDFYFLLTGKIQLVVDNTEGEFKFSKNIDENEYFGFK